MRLTLSRFDQRHLREGDPRATHASARLGARRAPGLHDTQSSAPKPILRPLLRRSERGRPRWSSARTLTMRAVKARVRGSLYSSVQPSQRAAVTRHAPAMNGRSLPCRLRMRGCFSSPAETRPGPRGRGVADERERDQVARERGEIDARSAVALRDRDRASRLEAEVFCGRERRGGPETPREGLRQSCLAEAWRVSGYRRSAPYVRIGVIGTSVQGVNVGRSRGE
jgi:hypothetical protein